MSPWLPNEQGRALRCRCCKGALLLNASSLKKHLQSKHHQKRVSEDAKDDLEEQVCFAEEWQNPESVFAPAPSCYVIRHSLKKLPVLA